MVKLMSIKKVSKVTGISVSTLYKNIKAGVLTPYKDDPIGFISLNLYEVSKKLKHLCSPKEETPEEASEDNFTDIGEDGWVSISEAAKHFGIKRCAVYARIHSGAIACRRDPDTDRTEVNVNNVHLKKTGKKIDSSDIPPYAISARNASHLFDIPFKKIRELIALGAIKHFVHKDIFFIPYSEAMKVHSMILNRKMVELELPDTAFSEGFISVSDLLEKGTTEEKVFFLESIVKKRESLYYSDTGRVYAIKPADEKNMGDQDDGDEE
jgi:hypothetical protein